jgi:hypothetical protein
MRSDFADAGHAPTQLITIELTMEPSNSRTEIESAVPDTTIHGQGHKPDHELSAEAMV